MNKREGQSQKGQSAKPSTGLPFVFVRITAITGKQVQPGIVILEHHAHTRKEFSSPVSIASNGFFVNAIECALRTDQNHWFDVHWIPPRQRQPLLTNRLSATERISLLSFKLDSKSLYYEAIKTGDNITSQNLTFENNVGIILEAYLNESFTLDAEELSEIVPVDVLEFENVIETDGATDMSFSSVSEDNDITVANQSSELGTARGSVRVRFDREIHKIPTTEKLEKDIQRALIERTTLSQAVGDLSSQFFQMKHEIRDVKECLRELSERTPPLQRSIQLTPRQQWKLPTKSKRKVVIDGDMVAETYISGKYSVEALELALRYYKSIDVSAVIVVSRSRVKELLPDESKERLTDEGALLQRLVNTQRVSITSSHSKRADFLIQYALDEDADIVTNDDFQRSLKFSKSGEDSRRVISFFEARRVPFMFIGDKFVPKYSPGSSSSTSTERRRVSRSDTM